MDRDFCDIENIYPWDAKVMGLQHSQNHRIN